MNIEQVKNIDDFCLFLKNLSYKLNDDAKRSHKKDQSRIMSEAVTYLSVVNYIHDLKKKGVL